MPARLGLVFHSCGHQTPIPGDDRHVDFPCEVCRSTDCLCTIHAPGDDFGCRLHAAAGCGLCGRAQAHIRDEEDIAA